MPRWRNTNRLRWRYQEAEPIARKFAGSFDDTYLTLARANLAVLQGDALGARRILKTIGKSMESNPSLYERGLYELLNGRIHLLQNRTGKAISALKACQAHFIPDGPEAESLCSRIWLAAALFQGGKSEAARDAVREALSEKQSVAHALVVVLRQAGPWLHGLQKDPQVGRILSGAFEKAGRLETKLPVIRRTLRRSARSIQAPAPSMIIRAFGMPHVLVNGKRITTADWQTQSVRELFFYLLAADRHLTKEQIGLVLWPDTIEPSRLKLRFKNDMYRLRRAVGRETILFDQEYYQFNHAVDHDYDVEAFEAYLAKAKSSHTPAEQIDHYQKAVGLVHGPYLEDIGATWVWPERERLSQAFLLALLTLAELYQREGQASNALSACQRALEHDPASEAVYRLMMQIYHRMGDRPSIIHIYETCVKTMRRIFDLAPSEETQKLYHDLQGTA